MAQSARLYNLLALMFSMLLWSTGYAETNPIPCIEAGNTDLSLTPEAQHASHSTQESPFLSSFGDSLSSISFNKHKVTFVQETRNRRNFDTGQVTIVVRSINFYPRFGQTMAQRPIAYKFVQKMDQAFSDKVVNFDLKNKVIHFPGCSSSSRLFKGTISFATDQVLIKGEFFETFHGSGGESKGW